MREMTEQQMDASIVEVLEQKPAVTIPAGFAARVAMAAASAPVAAPGLRVRLGQRVSVGKTAAIAALVMLVVAMFVLAPRVSGNLAMFGIEMLLLVQMAGIAWGLAVVRGSRG
jgi:hypothetical protein